MQPFQTNDFEVFFNYGFFISLELSQVGGERCERTLQGCSCVHFQLKKWKYAEKKNVNLIKKNFPSINSKSPRNCWVVKTMSAKGHELFSIQASAIFFELMCC